MADLSNPSPMQCSNVQQRTVPISSEHNLILPISEYECAPDSTRSQSRLTAVTDLQVKRETFMSSSSFFHGLFLDVFSNSDQSVLELTEDSGITAKALEIWFRALHNTLDEESYRVQRPLLWIIIAAGDKYGLNLGSLTTWFEQWYDRNEAHQDPGRDRGQPARQLLLPCWAFNHVKGFMAVTRWLVYHCVSHIEEENPTSMKHIKVPRRVIQQLNAARGRLKTVLHDRLWTPIEKPLKQGTCECKEKMLFAYQRRLCLDNIWPLERTFTKVSVHEMLRRLDLCKFDGDPPKSCVMCRIDCQKVVKYARQMTASYFDGLCLHCIEKTADDSKRAEKQTYWYVGWTENWDDECPGVRHGEPSWYFSYMGTDPHRNQKSVWYDQF